MSEKQAQQLIQRVNADRAGEGSTTRLESKGNPGMALEIHAVEMEKRHALHDRSGPCEFCGLRPPKWRVRLDWLTVYNTKADIMRSVAGLVALLAIGHGRTSEHKVRFTTYHFCCSDCYRPFVARRIASVVAEKLCLVILVLGILGVVGAITYGVVIGSSPSYQNKLIFAATLAVALVCIVIGIGMPNLLRKLRTPRALRAIGVWPFFLESSGRSGIESEYDRTYQSLKA